MATKNILVVDDDTELSKALKKVLSKDEYQVSTAANASEAMELVRDGGFDLVITDLSMPGENGIALLRKIKEVAPASQVIFLTAFGAWDNYGEAMAAGAAEFLSKPINSDELLKCVHRTLEKKS